jgi:hypothetical protein
MGGQSSAELASELSLISNDSALVEQFKRYNLCLEFVKGEDKSSKSEGPNMSDITIDIGNISFPIINTNIFRSPYLSMSINRFTVSVGNEKPITEAIMKRISFIEYIQDLNKYISSNIIGSMLIPRDEIIITSVQTSILPDIAEKIHFNIRIHNYEYNKTDPAVLVITASSQGTSAQLVTEYRQKIYFNANGKRSPFCVAYGKLNKSEKKETEQTKQIKQPVSFEDMSGECIFIFQIPLKQKTRPDDISKNNIVPVYKSVNQSTSASPSDVWTGTSSKFTLERNTAYPIRCTIQYYHGASSTNLSDNSVADMSQKIWRLYNEADARDALLMRHPSESSTRNALVIQSPPPSSENYNYATDPIWQYIEPLVQPTTQYTQTITQTYPIPNSYTQPVQYPQSSVQYPQSSVQYPQIGTQYSQPGTQYTQPDTQYSQPGTQYSQPGTQYSQPGTQYLQASYPVTTSRNSVFTSRNTVFTGRNSVFT